jgi:hypothetical protein
MQIKYIKQQVVVYLIIINEESMHTNLQALEV